MALARIGLGLAKRAGKALSTRRATKAAKRIKPTRRTSKSGRNINQRTGRSGTAFRPITGRGSGRTHRRKKLR